MLILDTQSSRSLLSDPNDPELQLPDATLMDYLSKADSAGEWRGVECGDFSWHQNGDFMGFNQQKW